MIVDTHTISGHVMNFAIWAGAISLILVFVIAGLRYINRPVTWAPSPRLQEDPDRAARLERLLDERRDSLSDTNNRDDLPLPRAAGASLADALQIHASIKFHYGQYATSYSSVLARPALFEHQRPGHRGFHREVHHRERSRTRAPGPGPRRSPRQVHPRRRGRRDRMGESRCQRPRPRSEHHDRIRTEPDPTGPSSARPCPRPAGVGLSPRDRAREGIRSAQGTDHPAPAARTDAPPGHHHHHPPGTHPVGNPPSTKEPTTT